MNVCEKNDTQFCETVDWWLCCGNARFRLLITYPGSDVQETVGDLKKVVVTTNHGMWVFWPTSVGHQILLPPMDSFEARTWIERYLASLGVLTARPPSPIIRPVPYLLYQDMYAASKFTAITPQFWPPI